MRLVGPAPTDLAKSARMSSNISLQTALAMFHTVRPLAESRDVEPLEAMMAERDRPLADRRPHAAYNRLQTDAVFIHRPDFNGRIRMLLLLLVSRGLKLFLSAQR